MCTLCLYILLNTADITSTKYGLAHNNVKESNPLLRSNVSLIATKAITTAVIYKVDKSLTPKPQKVFRIFVIASLSTIVLHNLSVR